MVQQVGWTRVSQFILRHAPGTGQERKVKQPPAQYKKRKDARVTSFTMRNQKISSNFNIQGSRKNGELMSRDQCFQVCWNYCRIRNSHGLHKEHRGQRTATPCPQTGTASHAEQRCQWSLDGTIEFLLHNSIFILKGLVSNPYQTVIMHAGTNI